MTCFFYLDGNWFVFSGLLIGENFRMCRLQGELYKWKGLVQDEIILDLLDVMISQFLAI